MAPRPPSPSSSSNTPALSAFAPDSTTLTPHVGTSFTSATQLSSILSAPNSDELVHDLASLISQRGVVFFSAQDLDVEQQHELMERLGVGSNRPESSSLHRHPVSETTSELKKTTSVISSTGGISRAGLQRNTRASNGWHADITFEPVPSDYACLKMHTIPEVGGDTLWASGYEAYDRLSPVFQKMLEGVTAEHDGNFFHDVARQLGVGIQDLRGSPLNVGTDLRAEHPVIRTHPITGWRTLFVNKGFTTRINGMTPDESSTILDYLFRHIAENHDFQVRYRWGQNDVAIWDNRCTFHTATNDYGNESRQGNRVVGIGEVPYFDPKSRSRREALANDAAA